MPTAGITGTYCFIAIDSTPSSLVQQCISNPYIDGVAYYANWATIEPSDGQYDFSEIDNMLAASGTKKFTLEIFAGDSSPAWLYTEDPTAAFPFIVGKGPNTCKSVNVPVPYNATVLNRLKALMVQLGQKYGNNPQVIAISVTGLGITNVTASLPYAIAPKGLGTGANTATISDGAMTAGSAILTDTTSQPFATCPVGLPISVSGAGNSGFGSYLISTVVSCSDSAHATLANPALKTVSGASVSYGQCLSDDDTGNWVKIGYNDHLIEDPLNQSGSWDQIMAQAAISFPSKHWTTPISSGSACEFPPIDQNGVRQTASNSQFVNNQDCGVVNNIFAAGESTWKSNWMPGDGSIGGSTGTFIAPTTLAAAQFVPVTTQEAMALGSNFPTLVNTVLAQKWPHGIAIEIYVSDVSNSGNQSALAQLQAGLAALPGQ